MAILITGASGYIGHQLVKKLLDRGEEVVGVDISERAFSHPAYHFYLLDIRDRKLEKVFLKHSITKVAHLACIVTPRPNMDRDFMYSVDIEGTKNILEFAKKFQIKTLSVASSGAAYGYHMDNPEWLKENHPVRGNKEFPYSYHKALVEKMLHSFQEKNPTVDLFIFRIGTVLGKSVNNQITDLFKKPFLIGIRGSESPFVFIWDEELIHIFVLSIIGKAKPGIYNIASDGKVTIKEMGEELSKRIIFFPSWLLASLLFILKRLRLTQYGEEQINFLRYRPVLSNEKLVDEFSYKPKLSSIEVFRKFITFERDRQ